VGDERCIGHESLTASWIPLANYRTICQSVKACAYCSINYAHTGEIMTSTRKPARPRRTRRARNLSLSDDAVARGEAYAHASGTSLSALVDRLLRALPADELPADDELPPALRRLRAMLATHTGPPRDWRKEHREHLDRKYAGRPKR